MANIKYTKDLLEPIVKSSKCWREVCEALGLKGLSGSQWHAKKKAESLDIDFTHFIGRQWNKGRVFGPKTRISLLLVKNGTSNSNWLKKRIIKEGLKKEQCERCLRTKWEGGKIPLHLHHKNGKHTDNRITNLEILCPNCHSLCK